MGAGGRDGYIPASMQVFPTKSEPAAGDDYHADVNGELWLKWMRERVIPNLLDKPCALFLNNAPYHRMQVRAVGFV